MACTDEIENMTILGQFHPNIGSNVSLSEGRRVACGCPSSLISSPQIAYSSVPIPKGLRFSVKVLQEFKGLAVLYIGITANSPDSGPLPQWGDINGNAQYWHVLIKTGGCTAHHKRQQRLLPWVLDRSAGNTFGCHVLKTGDLHLYHNGRDMGVALKGLPTDQPLWGFVILHGWKVEANYAIAKSHSQDYADKTFHFVERPPEGLICAVCQALANNPVQANCCGNIYCSQCIEKWKTRSNSCPVCRSTERSQRPFSVFEDRRAYRDVQNLKVHCPNNCGKKMELSAIEKHLMSDNGCPDEIVECANKCGYKESRGTVKKHMTSECHLRQEKCKYCSLVSTHTHITGVHLEECSNYPLNCPNKCGAQDVTRSTVSAHQDLCPLQQVECEYKGLGCPIVLLRKDVAAHLKTSVEAHLQMTKRRVEEQEVHLQEEKVERQLMEVRLKDVKERAERDRQTLDEVIAYFVHREQLEIKK